MNLVTVLGICLGGSLAGFFLHGALIRLRPPIRSRQALAALVCLLILVTNFFALCGSGEAPLWLAGILAATCAHLYFHIFNMSETARRIRVLIQLDRNEAPAHYRPQRMLSQRLERLLALGWVEKNGDKFRLAPGRLPRLAGALAALLVSYQGWLFPIHLESVQSRKADGEIGDAL